MPLLMTTGIARVWTLNPSSNNASNDNNNYKDNNVMIKIIIVITRLMRMGVHFVKIRVHSSHIPLLT